MKAHPFADEYPTMPQADLDRMTDDMREHGFDRRFPVVIYKRMILDGRSRWAASRAAKIKAKTIQFKGTEEQARQFVITANEHRRHLSQEWLEKKRGERIDKEVEARQEGKSIRTIAEEVGASKSQVERDLAEAGATVPRGTVESKDGKSRPATNPRPQCDRCQRVGPVKGCPACKELRGRQPGDEPKRAPTAKAGSVSYDWRPFFDGYGLTLRQVDKLGSLYGCKESGEAEKLRAQLSEFKVMFKEWFAVLSRTPAPKE